MWMPRPQLQFMNFYAHLSSVPGLPNCSYANELQRVFSSLLSSPSSHPSKKRVATKQRRQRGRRRSCCHVECVTHVYCTKSGGRNVLNYCIALIYTLLQPSFPVPSSALQGALDVPSGLPLPPCRPLGTAFCRQCSCEVLSTLPHPPHLTLCRPRLLTF